MPPRPAISELLASLSAILDALGTRWYVFGAQAVVAYGLPRMTADVDVTAEIALEAVPRALAALRAGGFEVRVADVEAFVEKTRVLPLVHVATRMPMDLVLAGSGLEVEFLSRAKRLDLGGIEVPVISAEDLVVTKILAGRPKDLEDVRGVLREQGNRLDIDRVRELLAILEEALDRRDLIPELDQSLSGVKARRRRK